MSLKEQAIRRHMNELAAQAVPMSNGDSVRIYQAQPEAIGVYIDAQQQNQDAFANGLAQQQMSQGNVGYQPVVPIVSPNTTVVEPTRTRESNSSGTYQVIY